MRCPGQDTQYWQPDAIYEVKCPECDGMVEFFKDDTTRKCEHCGHKFPNPKMDFGCAAYCKYAEQCIGDLPPELIAQQQDLLKDRVAVEMKKYFGRDFRRIGHASRVAHFAEKIGKAEEADKAIVLIAAYLHDIGIPEAERKHGSGAAKFQEAEGPPVARALLEKLGAAPGLVDEVCDIVGRHHSPGPEESINYRCVYDADLIVNLEEAEKKREEPLSTERLESIIEKSFLTETGAKMAREVLGAKDGVGA
jgi:HD superfamily phosphodiesterase